MVFYIVLPAGESCSLEQMISRVFGKDDLGQYGLRWLQKNFLGEIAESREFNLNWERDFYEPELCPIVTEEELKEYRYYHPYMYARKLTNEVIQKFDVGFDASTNSLTFPIKDEKGKCLFVARRSVIGKYFNYPPSVGKPVYGLYELPKNIDEVIVCESMINCLTCYVYERPAVALNGTGTQYQIDQLKKLNCRKLILALDPDNAGRKGMLKLYNALKDYKIITFLKGIPEGNDINDLSKEQFDSCYETFTL
jgi:DNA primase